MNVSLYGHFLNIEELIPTNYMGHLRKDLRPGSTLWGLLGKSKRCLSLCMVYIIFFRSAVYMSAVNVLSPPSCSKLGQSGQYSTVQYSTVQYRVRVEVGYKLV